MSCTVAHGLRPRYVYYRRQEATTVESVDVQTEAQTIIGESINPETENNQAAEKESVPSVGTPEAPEKEFFTEKPVPSQEIETENPTEKLSEQQITVIEIENQPVIQNLQENVTPEPQDEETETAAPVELQTYPTIEPTQADPELESKPTEEAPEDEAGQQKEAEEELKEQDLESEAQQNEQEQEQNDQEAKIGPMIVPRVQIDNGLSVVAQQEPSESDQKDTDIAMKDADHTNENQLNDAKIKSIVSKYINSVPDIKSQYVLNEGLAKSITHYFKNKVVALPLFHLNMKIDRNLVKIPWQTGLPLPARKKKAYPYRVISGLQK